MSPFLNLDEHLSFSKFYSGDTFWQIKWQFLSLLNRATVLGGPRGLQGQPADDPRGARGGGARARDLVVEGRRRGQVRRPHQGMVSCFLMIQ